LLELEPKYCDVAVSRWQDHTGKSAVLDGDGRPFTAIVQEPDHLGLEENFLHA
jgi:hypothetical protein